jgi:hypothetical protein
MFRPVLPALLGTVMLLGSLSPQAGPILDSPAVEPGDTTTVMADFGIAGLSFFDLLLNVPGEFLLLSIYDDPSDGGVAQYQRYYVDPTFGLVLDPTAFLNGADFNANGVLGVRVTDLSLGTQGFAKIKLDFGVFPTTGVGSYSIPYQYLLNGASQQGDSFVIRVGEAPAPGALVLILVGLGTLAVVRRRARS